MWVERGVRTLASAGLLSLLAAACGAEGDWSDEVVDEASVSVQSNCGNGRLNSGEQCDDGNRNHNDGCTNACKLARCGDGIHQSNEQCDDGNRNHNDSCLNQCKLARCGDGVVRNGSEQCDDANTNNNDQCTNDCRIR
jgi:cysteine-rich repeat protein